MIGGAVEIYIYLLKYVDTDTHTKHTTTPVTYLKQKYSSLLMEEYIIIVNDGWLKVRRDST